MGWARANILFDKAKRLPEPDSPMERLFIILWKMRQDIEFHKSRAMMQALLSQKGAEDKTILSAFSDLREAFFPFDKGKKVDEDKSFKDALMREIGRGPLSVTPTEDMGRKKMANRLAKGQQEMARKISDQQTGKSRPIDAFDKAKRRPRDAF